MEAQRIYESLGYRVVLISSNYFSDSLRGSLHCLTMTYPDLSLDTLLGALHLHRDL
jgi:ribosomal protein S18 acetylase RimI-like enzyme